ncbi:uncharacterized protein [Prorops nasuta]|uniref:uncharacterized protein n=1 Tax=Prorops nasuta TaxID=863751 RepID=UPI0034CD49FC
MNDSFLEDLGLVSENFTSVSTVNLMSGNIAKKCITSTPLMKLPIKDSTDPENIKKSIVSSVLNRHESNSEDIKNLRKRASDNKKQITTKLPGKLLTDIELKEQEVKLKLSKKLSKTTEKRLKPLESKFNAKEPHKSNENRINIEDRYRRSAGSRQSRLSDSSSKENKQPCQVISEPCLQQQHSKEKNYLDDDGLLRKSDCLETDNIAPMLATLKENIKEIVETSVMQESSKILRSMQDLHIMSQSSLIKQLIMQEELLQESLGNLSLDRIKILVEENTQLHHNVDILQRENQELKERLIRMTDKLECRKTNDK